MCRAEEIVSTEAASTRCITLIPLRPYSGHPQTDRLHSLSMWSRACLLLRGLCLIYARQLSALPPNARSLFRPRSEQPIKFLKPLSRLYALTCKTTFLVSTNTLPPCLCFSFSIDSQICFIRLLSKHVVRLVRDDGDVTPSLLNASDSVSRVLSPVT